MSYSGSGSFYDDRSQNPRNVYQLSDTSLTSASGQANPRAPSAHHAEPTRGYLGQASSDASQPATFATQPSTHGPFKQYPPMNTQHRNPRTMYPTTAFTLTPQRGNSLNLPFPYGPTVPAPHSTPYSSLAGATDYNGPPTLVPQHRSGLDLQLPAQPSSGGGVVRRAMTTMASTPYDNQRPIRYHRRAASELGPYGEADESSFSRNDHTLGSHQVCCPSSSSKSKLMYESQNINLSTNRGGLASHLPDASVPLTSADHNSQSPVKTADHNSQSHGNIVPELQVPVPSSNPASAASDGGDAMDADSESHPDPPVSDVPPKVESLDDAVMATVMDEYIYGYLVKHLLNATWPTEHEFKIDLAKSCDHYSIPIQGYIETHIQPEVHPSLFAFTFDANYNLFKTAKIYRDAMSHGFYWAEQIWLKNIQKDGMDSRPLHLKCYVNGRTLSQCHLHTYYSGDSGRTIHLTNEMVLELFRRLIAFFQERLPGLKSPPELFCPGALVFPSVLVYLVSLCVNPTKLTTYC